MPQLALVAFTVMVLTGCQHDGRVFGRAYHELDPETCAVIASGKGLHEVLKRMRSDGSCDVRPIQH